METKPMRVCPLCDSTGKFLDRKCRECNGTGNVIDHAAICAQAAHIEAPEETHINEGHEGKYHDCACRSRARRVAEKLSK